MSNKVTSTPYNITQKYDCSSSLNDTYCAEVVGNNACCYYAKMVLPNPNANQFAVKQMNEIGWP